MQANRARKSLRGLILRHIVGQMFGRARLFTEMVDGHDHARNWRRTIAMRPSVYVRHLDCGSCNGCELELAALENPVYDMGHLGFEFKASPRHADVLVLTGPYTRNLDEAARRAFAAMPSPRRLVAIGDCAVHSYGSVYAKSYALAPRPDDIERAIVATAVGCPPTPSQIMTALLESQARMRQDSLSKRFMGFARGGVHRIMRNLRIVHPESMDK